MPEHRSFPVHPHPPAWVSRVSTAPWGNPVEEPIGISTRSDAPGSRAIAVPRPRNSKPRRERLDARSTNPP